nr:uncharacterized protein LOC127334519 [Lolium perenne]
MLCSSPTISSFAEGLIIFLWYAGSPHRPAAAPPRPAAPLAGPPGPDLARPPTTAGALARPAASGGRSRPQLETPEPGDLPCAAPRARPGHQNAGVGTPPPRRQGPEAPSRPAARCRAPSTPPRQLHAAVPAVLEPRPCELPLAMDAGWEEMPRRHLPWGARGFAGPPPTAAREGRKVGSLGQRTLAYT